MGYPRCEASLEFSLLPLQQTTAAGGDNMGRGEFRKLRHCLGKNLSGQFRMGELKQSPLTTAMRSVGRFQRWSSNDIRKKSTWLISRFFRTEPQMAGIMVEYAKRPGLVFGEGNGWLAKS